MLILRSEIAFPILYLLPATFRGSGVSKQVVWFNGLGHCPVSEKKGRGVSGSLCFGITFCGA